MLGVLTTVWRRRREWTEPERQCVVTAVTSTVVELSRKVRRARLVREKAATSSCWVTGKWAWRRDCRAFLLSSSLARGWKEITSSSDLASAPDLYLSHVHEGKEERVPLLYM